MGVMANGEEAPKTKLLQVKTSTVLCDESGRAFGVEDCPTEYQQSKTTFQSFLVAEKRRSPGGTVEDARTTLAGESLGRITALSVKIRGESYDLLEPGYPIQDLVLSRKVARIPAKASVSLVFTSDQGDVLSVADHQIRLDTGESDYNGACCVVQ